jgi:hypothetical protein
MPIRLQHRYLDRKNQQEEETCSRDIRLCSLLDQVLFNRSVAQNMDYIKGEECLRREKYRSRITVCSNWSYWVRISYRPSSLISGVQVFTVPVFTWCALLDVFTWCALLDVFTGSAAWTHPDVFPEQGRVSSWLYSSKARTDLLHF